MPDDEFISGDTTPWNVAKTYSFTHIQQVLDECQTLAKVAKFGSSEFTIEGLPPSVVTKNKIEAMDRLLFNLRRIIDNSKPLVKGKNVRRDQEVIKEKLNEIEKNMFFLDGKSALYRIEYDLNKRQNFVLIEPHCTNVLNELLIQLGETIMSVRNIIGMSSEEIDLDTLKQQIIEGG